MGRIEEVLMTVEESVHYPLTGERARVEWLSTSPAGVGYVRLGTPNRYIIPSMFHQMHCLRLIQHALDFGMDDPTYSIYHVQHCLNFLRQMTLCTPDLTLEPVDLDLAASSEGITHVCRDWEAIYTEVERNYYVWSNHTHT
ncbi:hypothetical protein PHLCEN_2v3873 [Hermanssonia centrifuga]|uniref:Uncharacterized protein n=1 Tax=Hermanssonia centrifuga TaxID=98765 RepID=A0A2R6QB95_9APHY|nr:hypothetical protein PHLCEN_2v3873 [Hermanssonia centrifuga]